MRDWTAAVRERLAREHAGTSVPADTIEEIAQHIADLHRGALLRGSSLAEADALAAAELADIDRVAAAVQQRRHRAGGNAFAEQPANLWRGIGRDLLHAGRLLATRRGYALVTVATLAVGIGGCAAVFSLFNALLLAPMPYPDQDRLVLLWETDAQDHDQQFIAAAPNYEDWKAETRSFEALGTWEHMTFNVAGAADPAQVPGARASSSLFTVLGVAPALGRVFTTAEDAPGQQIAIISNAVWRVHFRADPHVIGKSMRLNGTPHEIIGVMPAGFAFPRNGTGVWVPIAFTEQDRSRGSHSFYVAGRLKPDVTFAQARDEMQRLGAVMSERHTENRGEGATIQRLDEFGVANSWRILVALSGAVGLVLLIACVNVASLQLALGLSRRREFVTRLSLGARYAHLARQVFVESALVALLGCGTGIAIAFVVTRAVDVMVLTGFRTLPFRADVPVTVDLQVLLFAVAVSLAAALLFAFAPLLGLRRRSLQASLREGDRGATRLATGTRRVLVAVEIALAIVVLCGAGLMIRSLESLLGVPPGLDPQNVLVLQVSLPQTDTYGPPQRPAFCNDVTREIGSVAGVIRASAISHLPLSGANAGRGLTIEGRPEPAPNEGPSASYRLTCPDYFATLAIPILAGREFNARDTLRSEPVVIVNRAFAERYWPGESALGQRFKLGGFRSTNPWLTIVGIVDNVRHFGLEAAPSREIFRPYSQAAWPVMTVVAKTAGEPLLWQRPVGEALKRVEADLPAANAQSMEAVIGESVAWRETPMRLLTGFAIVALFLAGVGVYGVLAYYVSQRTRELGVRVALGASTGRVVGLVFRQSALPLAAGVALGVAGAIASGRRLLTDLLYEVQPGDPIVLMAVVGVLVIVSMLSSVLPARRAARTDPLAALREE